MFVFFHESENAVRGNMEGCKRRTFDFRKNVIRLYVTYWEKKKAVMIRRNITGRKSEMSPKWKEMYQVNGIGHILAISGLLSVVYWKFPAIKKVFQRKMGFSYKNIRGAVSV